MRNIFDPKKVQVIIDDIKLYSNSEQESQLLITELKRLLEMQDEDFLSNIYVKLDDCQRYFVDFTCGNVVLSYILEELCWNQASI